MDILVNNAARQVAQASLLGITMEQFDTTFKTNVYAMFWLNQGRVAAFQAGLNHYQHDLSQRLRSERGHLDYAATKGAIMIFTKGLAKQLAKKGIRVNAVAPGPIWTPLQVTGGQPREKFSQFVGDTPIGRPGQPAELAPLYVLLASDEASYSSGQVFGAVGARGGP